MSAVGGLLGLLLWGTVVGLDLITFPQVLLCCPLVAAAGAGLGEVIDMGKDVELDILLKPEILLPLIGLCILALLPVVYRRWKRRQAEE